MYFCNILIFMSINAFDYAYISVYKILEKAFCQVANTATGLFAEERERKKGKRQKGQGIREKG